MSSFREWNLSLGRYTYAVTELIEAPIKSRDRVGPKVDFSTLMLTPRHKRSLSNMEVEIQASSLDHAAWSKLSKLGEYKEPIMPEVGLHDGESFGEDPGSSGESKWQDPVLEVLRVYCKHQEQSVGQINICVEISILHIKSCKHMPSSNDGMAAAKWTI